MRLRAALVAAVATLGLIAWHSELWHVSPRNARSRPLELSTTRHPAPAGLDVSLPAVPIGMHQVRPDDAVLVLHYWAPWEQDGLAQARGLDSLRRSDGLEGLRVVMVCSDPFPSVARYVGRLRLHVAVMLDLRRELQAALPCPSVPYTWLLDARGRVVAAQPGEVEWLAPATRRLLLDPDAVAADSASASRVETQLPRPEQPGSRTSQRVQARTVAALGRTK